MSPAGPGRPLAAALLLCAGAAAGDTLSVATGDETLFTAEVEAGDEWCLRWNHSVTGGRVADCFVDRGGHMVLDRSYLHDFAAGLGEVPGRGVARPAEGGGYWIDDIDERIKGDTLPLRVGHLPVDHRLEVGGEVWPLSERAANTRVTIRLAP